MAYVNIVCQTVIREVGRILRLGAKKISGRGFSLPKFFELFQTKILFGSKKISRARLEEFRGYLLLTCTTFMAQQGRIIGEPWPPGPPPSNYLPDCNITIYETAADSSAPFQPYSSVQWILSYLLIFCVLFKFFL